jgi:hypothetical protein
MNTKLRWINFLRLAQIFAVLIAGFFLTPALRAQPAERTVPSRFLFVFDTSKNMKPRAEAMEKALNVMLATSLSGQLHAGDSIGIWTFGRNLHTGQYPLQYWDPDKAAMVASNLVKFVGAQYYDNASRFEALQPLLDKVVQDSERLTVIIFCDGEGEITGTPFDDAINQIFQDKSAEQKKAREPLVILLRSQLGQYVGCTVALPPQPVNVPQFPPLPAPLPSPKPANRPLPAPVIVGQPLIIIGKNVSNNVPARPTNAPAPSSPRRNVDWRE